MAAVQQFLVQHYEWLRALHIMAVIAWMAGLMYLPRLFVYHSAVAAGSDQDATFMVMERRLFRGIMSPSMHVVWALGLLLIWARGAGALFHTPWFLVKFGCVVGITICHVFYGIWQKAFARGARPLNHIAFRWLNELPFALMMLAVAMVVLEPHFT